jgi:hypothetical protein
MSKAKIAVPLVFVHILQVFILLQIHVQRILVVLAFVLFRMKLLLGISAYVHQVPKVTIFYRLNDFSKINFLQGINCESPVVDQVYFNTYLGRSLINEEAILKRLKDENLSKRFFKFNKN